MRHRKRDHCARHIQVGHRPEVPVGDAPTRKRAPFPSSWSACTAATDRWLVSPARPAGAAGSVIVAKVVAGVPTRRRPRSRLMVGPCMQVPRGVAKIYVAGCELSTLGNRIKLLSDSSIEGSASASGNFATWAFRIRRPTAQRELAR